MPDSNSTASAYRFAAMGLEFGGTIAAAVIAGYYLDDYLGTAPLMTLLLTLAGMYGALRLLLWSLKKHSQPG
jgi:F0F1-type ATP synthase assembly protein I